MSPPISADTLLGEARSALASGNVAAAKARVDRASAQLEPRHAELLFLLGNTFAERNEPAAAITVFERALKLAPGNPSLLNNLGLQLDAIGEPRRAERCYRDVLERRPGEISALANLAHLLFMQERYGEALGLYDRLVAGAPEAPADVWNNRGVCQKSIQNSAAAEESFHRALALQPDSPQVLANLGFLLYELVRYDEARPLLRRAHELDPRRLQVAAQLLDLNLQFADWGDFDLLRAQIIEGVRTLDGHPRQTVPPFTFLAICDDPSLQRTAARSFAWPAAPGAQSVALAELASPAKRLRIGFVSAAFQEHPETRLLIGLLERLDSDRFDVYAYALKGADAAPMRARVAKVTRGFREVERMSAGQIGTAIRDDAIAILFDLAGHTAHARPDVFAARPAPVQINFLGYAGTLGAAYYDYVITDAYTTPQSEQPNFEERLLPLAQCYIPSDPERVPGPRSSRETYGLPAAAFVFVSQAAPYKVLPEMFGLWARLLASVDRSVLWLRPMHPEAQSNLRDEARRRGIASGRLIFAPHEPMPQYLARYPLADLYLDTYPFGSHTTVNDALFAGLPVLTIAGRSMAARASASQLRAVGLAELIASSHEDYESIALALVSNRARLEDLTVRLRSQRRTSALFDMDSYTRRFEDAVLHIARNGDIDGRS
ncbi:MAG: tetratricopeptide repeat protein [Betaproteobacteria bacterium]|nr:MAG: tetratricopeptide repeat protein [Betaproteobacteria bacterium]